MKLQQVESFFWVVSLGSFAAAAERLHATQSTISMRIRELEKSLGVELFDRTQRKARLTPKGYELMEYAVRLRDLTAEIEEYVAAPDSVSGFIRLGAAEVVSLTWLPKLISEVSRIYPHVRLEIDQALAGDLVKGLQNGTLDMILTPGTVPTPDLNATSLGYVEFVWMASPSRGLGGKQHSASSLALQPVLGLTAESYHCSSVEAWFRNAGTRCRYLARCKSMSVVASMAVAGLGVAFLPIRCFARQIEAGELEVLSTETSPVPFIAATSAEEFHPLTGRVLRLARMMSDFPTAVSGTE